MPSSNQPVARHMPENHRLFEGDLLSLVKTLSTAWLAWLGKPKPSPKACARPTMDSAAGATSVALAQALSLVGQTQDLEGIVQGSGTASEHQHGWAHPGPAGALEAGQAETPAPVQAPRQALAVRDARQAARRAGAD